MPYIDVMLVLLIIFMVAAPLINPGQIDLPQVASKLDPAVAPLEVRVRPERASSTWSTARISADELRVTRANAAREACAPRNRPIPTRRW